MDRKAAACGASFLPSWPSFECLACAFRTDSLVWAICDPLNGIVGGERAWALCVDGTQVIFEFDLDEYSVLAAHYRQPGLLRGWTVMYLRACRPLSRVDLQNGESPVRAIVDARVPREDGCLQVPARD